MFRRKKMLGALLLLCAFVGSMTGCARNAAAAYRGNLAMPDNSGAELKEDVDIKVVLLVNQGWDDENDTKIPDAEYPLSGKDAEMIVDLFYSHEKEVLDSPLCSVETIRFQIGEDYLGTSMDSLHVLSGIVQGELVAIHLSEDECEALRKSISPYTQNIP